jgi:hypothetical protein
MSLKRWGFALLLTLSTAALAEPSAEPLASQEAPTESLTCAISRCSTDSQCWSYCPDAQTAACVSGYCRYTYPSTGGGGGGGGGGPVCQVSRCSANWQCVCEGEQYACVNGYCVY